MPASATTGAEETVRRQLFAAASAVLEVRGDEVATRFYERLFAANPRIAMYFRHVPLAHQRRKLAAVLQIIARYCDDPQALGPTLIGVSAAHMNRGIGAAEMTAFCETLAEVLGECQDFLSQEQARSIWREELAAVGELMLIVSET